MFWPKVLVRLLRNEPAFRSVLRNRAQIAAEELAALLRFMLIDQQIPPKTLAELEQQAVMRNYVPPRPLVLAANDWWLHDEDGNVYLDYQGAYSANNAGNANPRVTGANHLAASFSSVLSRARRNRQLPLMAHELQRALGIDYKVLPMNSGCEAIEGAVLLAKLVFNRAERFGAKRSDWFYQGKQPKVVFCQNNFHGRSSWAKAASSNPAYRDPFEPNCCESEMVNVEFGNVEQLAAAFEQYNCIAFVAEPIQCEGGMNVPAADYFRQVRELCDRHNVLLVLDEVQTGLGRTGAMLGQHHFFDGRVGADIISLAKSLSGGQEVASVIMARPELADLIRPSEHGSTFGGTPKASATIRAAVRELEDRELCAAARSKGDYLLAKLRMLCESRPEIIDVRGVGLAIGIEVHGHGADEICDRWRRTSFVYHGREIRGCWTNSTHGITDETTVIRLSPPLTAPTDLLDASLYSLALALKHPEAEKYRRTDLESARSAYERGHRVGNEMRYLKKRARRFWNDLQWVKKENS